MSIEVMRYVWKHSKAKANNRLMLLAIADIANDSGDAYPGIDRLAVKCAVSDRAAQDCIHELERMGELQVFENCGTKTRSGWTNLYRVVLPDVQQSEVRQPDGETASARPPKPKKLREFPKGVKLVAPLKEVKPVSPDEVKLVAPHGVKLSSPDSSVYPPGDSPVNTRTENKDISPVGGLPQSIPEIASGLEGGKPSDGEQAGEGDSKPIQSLEGNAQNGATLPDPKPPVPVAPLSPTEGQGDKKPRPKNPLQEAVAYAFSTTTGPFAGQLGSMLTGTATKGQWKEWAITEPPMTPAEIWGARLWYNAEPRYKEQSKNGLPRTAETLHTRILEYRSSPKHAEFLRRAENLLAAHLGQDSAELDDTDFQHLFPPPAETDGIPYTGQPSNIDLKAWKAEYEQQKEGAV